MQNYIKLTKPGIVMGNAITAAGGFALASKGSLDGWLFLAMLAGLSLIIASGCVLNNYIDRVSDEKMERTKNRPLAQGLISKQSAFVFAFCLGLAGAMILGFFTNWISLMVSLAGFAIYVGWYSFWKYRTHYATLIGSIAGAVPPVVGYCAVTGRIDLVAALLFAILILWQMPHFFAIAIYRINDYAAASIPVLPIVKGAQRTKIQMLCYVIAFLVAALSLPLLGYTGLTYLAVVASLGIAWLALAITGFKASSDKRWARQMFAASLGVITILCSMLTVDTL